jgi:aquaporin Z
MTRRGELAALIVEFLGVFTLVFIGVGAITLTNGQNLVAIALAHGLAIGLMVAAGGHISGGVYNPAVAIALMATRKLPLARGAAFIVAELFGGIVGALVVKGLYPVAATEAVRLGTPLPAAGVSDGRALLVELILTFFLMFVIFGVAVDRRGPATIAGLAIGLTIAMDIFGGGGISGAAMNPARSLGPALVQNEWRSAWVYWVGPIAGALAAAVLYNSLLLDTAEDEEDVALPQPE